MTGECTIPAFYDWSEPIARKQHDCCECDAPILAGERHFCCRGKWDGKISTFRQHLLCCEMCEFVRDTWFDGEECIAFGGLKEYWREQRTWYDRKGSDRTSPTWIKLRHLIAQILWRERTGGRA
jgi:hypothetical protein